MRHLRNSEALPDRAVFAQRSAWPPGTHRRAFLRRRLTPIAVAAAVLSGCTGDGAETPDPPPAAATDTRVAASPGSRGPLECEVQGYPCTWDEVDSETVTRTHLLGEIASFLAEGGSDTGEVAAFLAEDTTVAEVMIAGSRIRFRLRGGRPGWILPPDEMDHHLPDTMATERGVTAAPPPSVPTSGVEPDRNFTARLRDLLVPRRLVAAHPESLVQEGQELRQGIAAEEPGKPKKALVISPFAYQWMGNVSAAAVRMLRGVRDYRSDQGGKVIYHADLDMLSDNPPTPGEVAPSGEVVFDDFLHWDDYNLVLVVTHGYPTECDAVTMPPAEPPGRRRPGGRGPWTLYDDEWEDRVAEDPDLDPAAGCPKVWAGRAKQSSYGAYPGVEIGWFSPALHVGTDPPPQPDTRYGTPDQGWTYEVDDHPGLTLEEARWCRAEIDAGVPEPTTAGERKPCTFPHWEHKRPIVGLTLPFFRDRYPDGLSNTIAFVAACWSGLNYYLMDQLTGFDRGTPNENVAAFGFFAVGVNGRDYQTAIPTMLEQIDLGYHAWKVLNAMREASPQVVGRAFGDEQGGTAAQGRDVTELWDPTAGHELEHGSMVPIIGVADDGEPDTLDIRPTFVGVSDPASLEDVRLRVRVDGNSVSDEDFEPTRRTGREGAYEYPGAVPLGRDAEEDDVVDLEIEADLPGGRKSRWMYEDVVLGRCSAPIDGTYEGELRGALGRRVQGERGTGSARIRRRRAPADPARSGDPPLGEWHLTLRSSVKWGDDLTLNVYFPGDPEPGRSVTVNDVGLTHLAVSGGVSEPENVNWHSGTVRIRFTGIDENPGSADLGVCGDIEAQLVGMKDPPSGAAYPVEVPATFEGTFRAAWRKP